MKKKSIFLILVLSVAVLTFQSCGDDSPSVKKVLLTSNRATGQFYTINLSTGALSPAFKVKYNDETLFDIRGFVYHPGENAFYASLHSYTEFGEENQLGLLFKIDPSTKVATLINDNDGDNTVGGGTYDVWDAIVNWAVDSDDSLLAVGDFNTDGNGFVKFGTDGDRSPVTIQADVCCGLGMIYDSETKEALLGNDPSVGEIFVEKFNVETGASLDTYHLTTFNGFPDSFNSISATSMLKLKGLVQNSDGKYYGLVYNEADESNKTYFVSLDFENLSVKYISTLGISKGDQYNVLTFVTNDKF